MMNTVPATNEKKPSLFPYIKSGNSAIRIDFLSAVPSLDKKKPAFPFEILTHPDPLAYLVKARLVTDADSEIRQLFILFQRDQVQPVKGASFPADNPAVARYWQQAFNHFSNNKSFDDCLIRLGDQLTDDGHLLPFQPLFHCALKKEFFPPPCPLCGGELDLCDDDKMLTAAGLHPYTHSLRRYLFCPTCYQLAGETDFYTNRSKSPDEKTAKTVVELINGFKNLATSTSRVDQFPCRNCPEVSACHAPNGPLLTRISPIAFYPFHILIFKADSVTPVGLSVFNAEESNMAPSPKSHRVQVPSSQDRNKSILIILKDLVDKWELELVKKKEKPPLIKASEQPSRISPNGLSGGIAMPTPVLNENPDLQETIIVSTSRNRSSVDEKPNSPVNGDMPETIIVGAIEPNSATNPIRTTRPASPGNNHPESPVGDSHRSSSLIAGAMAPQPPGALPETMIIRPLEPESNAPATGNLAGPAGISSKQPNQSDQKKIVSNTIGSPAPTRSFFLGDKQGASPPEPENAFLKTFALGPDQNNPNDFGKEVSGPSVSQNKARVPPRPDTENDLAETIIVSPSKKDKDRK